ncbi:unnamed protein product [Linum trigynum]|uniref:Uncharacterized protein n=1 Tax=Linum trigynum TaxID=586398 RepID=A0AAV2CZC9_9ROSI
MSTVAVQTRREAAKSSLRSEVEVEAGAARTIGITVTWLLDGADEVEVECRWRFKEDEVSSDGFEGKKSNVL